MKRLVNRIIASLGAIMISGTLYGQTCEEQLEKAQRAYYNGNLDQTITLLENCVHGNELGINDRETALRLMINAHLTLNQEEPANILMQKLLTLNPLLKTKPSDLVKFQKLFDSYRVTPKYSIGISAGGNLADFEIMQYRSYAAYSEEPTDYTAKLNPSLGISGEYALLKNLSIGLSMLYQKHSYQYSETLLDLQELTVTENLNYLYVPVFAKYFIDIPYTKFFIQGGISAQVLLNANADLTLLELVRDFPPPIFGNSAQEFGYDLGFQRKAITYNYTLGAGFRRQFGYFNVELAFSYDYGLNNLVKTAERYTNSELLTQFSYVPDDYKMNQYRVTINVLRTFYQAKKL